MKGHTDRATINKRKPLTDGMRRLLERMAKPGGYNIGCDQGNASRARALMDRGYAFPPALRGGPWRATESGLILLNEVEG